MTRWDIAGRSVLITGGTTGIGRATATELAGRGAHVIFTARTAVDGDSVIADVRRRTPDAVISYRELHLDSLGSVRSFAAELRRDLDRLDVLINNAGISLTERRLTEDGHEAMFGVNHLGHFLLVEELRDLLAASAPARIVIVASDAHRFGGPLDFDDLQNEHKRFGMIGGMKTYGRSKLANLLHCRELARQLDGTGVTANALHPGFVRTRIARDSEATKLGERVVWPLIGRFALSPEEGAATSVHLACADTLPVPNGGYYTKQEPADSNDHARDDVAATQLWKASSDLVAEAT